MKRLLAGLCLVLGLLCAWEYVLLGRVRQQAALLEQTVLVTRHDLNETKQKLTLLDARAPAPVRRTSADDNPLHPVLELTPYLKNDPDWAEVRRLESEHRVDQTYPNLSALNLPPNQLAKLRQLLLERFQAEQDASQSARASGIKDWSTIGKAVAAADADVDSDIAQVVGQGGLAQLAQMRNIYDMRMQIQNTVGQDMALSGAGLTSAQLEALAQSVSQATGGAVPKGIDAPARLAAAITAAAPNVVTPDQLAVLEASLSLRAKYSAVQHRAMQAAQKDNPDAANSSIVVISGD